MDDFDTIPADIPPEFQESEAPKSEEGFPSVRYGPDGQSGVFNSAKDVPSGWRDHPSKVPGAPDPSKDVSERRKSRAELIKELRLLKVDFNPQASPKQLESILTDAENKAKMEKVREAKKAKPKAKAKAKRAPKAVKRAGKK